MGIHKSVVTVHSHTYAEQLWQVSKWSGEKKKIYIYIHTPLSTLKAGEPLYVLAPVLLKKPNISVSHCSVLPEDLIKCETQPSINQRSPFGVLCVYIYVMMLRKI